MLLAAAKALSKMVPKSALSEEYILPSVFDKPIVPKVATAVAQAAIDSGIARKTKKEAEEEC
jgi:malate dehydrogenase (oxaloacetate-decarboxylating)